MKSIDELLREDAERWVGEQAGLVNKTGQTIMSKVAKRTRLYWLSGLGLITFATIAVGVYQYNASSQAKVTHVPTFIEVNRAPTASASTTPESLLEEEHRVSSDAAAPAESRTNLKAGSSASSFESEVQRISLKAAQVRAADPLAAMLQYDGLARLCESHTEYAMAVAAWQNAVELAAQVGDDNHLQRMRHSLENARRKQ